jgi:hypothetical protein
MVALEVTMSRPKKLSDKTRRITIALEIEVYRHLKVQSALRDVPVSLMAEEIIRASIKQTMQPAMSLPVPTNPLYAAMSLDIERFPLGWSGDDINQRLYRLGRTQKELGASLGIRHQTLNRWCRNGKIPPEHVGPIKDRLLEWTNEFNKQKTE